MVSHPVGTTLNGVVISTTPRVLTAQEWTLIDQNILLSAGCNLIYEDSTSKAASQSDIQSASFYVKNKLMVEYVQNNFTGNPQAFAFATMATWTINHTLPNPRPEVLVIATNGEFIEPDIQYTTSTQVVLNFKPAQSGTAYLR